MFLKKGSNWLIQTGIFKENIYEIKDISSIVYLNSMPKEDFNKESLELSMKRMIVNSQFYGIIRFPKYVNTQGEELEVYGPILFKEQIKKNLDALIKGNNLLAINSLVPCLLNEYLKGNYTEANFWWNIEGDFYIFFGVEHEKLILQLHKNLLFRSNDVVVGDWDTLASYYAQNFTDLDSSFITEVEQRKQFLIRKLIRSINTQINKKANEN